MDDFHVVRFACLIENRSKDFALQIVLKFLMIVVFFLETIVELRSFCAQYENDIEPSAEKTR